MPASELTLGCGHFLSVDVKRFAWSFGYQNLEVLCHKCGAYRRLVRRQQMELSYGSETTQVMGKS